MINQWMGWGTLSQTHIKQNVAPKNVNLHRLNPVKREGSTIMVSRGF
jgi:hypothetical protein